MDTKNKWTNKDCFLSLLVYRDVITRDTFLNRPSWENKKGSLKLKLDNIKYLDTNGSKGLGEYSKNCKEIYDTYKNHSNKELSIIYEYFLEYT